MEPWQKIHIIRNLSELLEITDPHVKVLTRLEGKGVLSNYDVQKVNTGRTTLDKAESLYKCIMTRTNGYVHLIKALIDENQTGAYSILLAISSEMISNLQVVYLGKAQPVTELLDSGQILEVETWLKDYCNDVNERLKIHESIFNQKGVVKLLRDTIPAPCPLYISRVLSCRIVVNPEVFKESCSDVFVFKNIDIYELGRLNITNDNIETSTDQLLRNKITSRFITLDAEGHWDSIEKILGLKSVHLLRVEKEGSAEQFLLERTNGVTSVLRQHLKNGDNPKYIHEDELIKKVIEENEKGVCICDLPGMGKTLLLANLARKISETFTDRVAVFIKLKIFDLREKSLDAKSEILNSVTTSKFAGRVLYQLVESKKIKLELLFDGLDEVSVDKLEQTTNLLKKICDSIPNARVYVTSRPVFRNKLETSLGVVAYDILPFDEQTQLKYLTSCWEDSSCDKEKLNQYARVCLENFKRNITQRKKDIAGIPLQCKLIADVYCKQARTYADKNLKNRPDLSKHFFVNSMWKIYSLYMERQFGVSKCTLNCLATDNCMCSDIFCQVKRFHFGESIQLIFPKLARKLPKNVTDFNDLSIEKILSPGLLERRDDNTDQLEFVHRTFAEYLVAEYFCKAIFTQSEASEQQMALQQLAFDQLFKCWDSEDEWLYALTHNPWVVVRSRLREHVVAYFLNALLSEHENIDVLCKAKLTPLDNFLAGMEGCMHDELEELLKIYLKASENCEQVVLQFKEDSEEDVMLKNVMNVAVKVLNTKFVQKFCDFFAKKLNVNLLQLEYNQLRKPIQLAIWRGDYELTQYLLKAVPPDNLIYWCVYGTYLNSLELVNKKLRIADMLLQTGSASLLTDPNKFSERENPILTDQIHLKLIKFLGDNGANFKQTRFDGRNVLYAATQYMNAEDFLELSEYLLVEKNELEYFSDPVRIKEYINYKGRQENYNMTRLVLTLLQFLNRREPLSKITKIQKLSVEPTESFEEYLKALLEPDFYNENKDLFSILFHVAIHEGFIEVAKHLFLLDSSLIQPRVNMYRTTIPILFAAKDFETFKFLVNKGANIFSVDSGGQTILHCVTKLNDCDFLNDLLSYLGSMWDRSDVGTTSTSQNCKETPNNIKELFRWREKGSERTPLHYAAYYIGDFAIDLLDKFLECGRLSAEEINAVDAEGNTALHVVLQNILSLNVDAVKALIDRGINWKIKNKAGYNAAQICIQNSGAKHIKFFSDQYGFNINELDSNGNNALQYQLLRLVDLNITRGRVIYEDLKGLIDIGVNKLHRNNEGKTAYDIAKEKKLEPNILELLE